MKGKPEAPSPARVRLSPDNIEQEVEKLPTLSRPELAQKWIHFYGRPPPKYIKRGLIERAVAWQMQARVFGGLKPETHRLLMSIAEADAAKRKGEAPPAPKFRPGMRLLREWNGTVHTVDVLDKGFAWNGKLYSSLSPIAREITGARWSGPRFFTP